MARCSWATVAVGSQLGFHLGYPGHPCEPAGMQPPGCQRRRLTREPGPVLARAALKKAGCKKIK